MPRPLHDRVWLRFPSGERSVGAVKVPATSPDQWMDATVVAVGPEVSGDFGVGDVVIASLYDGMPVEVDGTPLRSVPAAAVLAVLEG